MIDLLWPAVVPATALINAAAALTVWRIGHRTSYRRAANFVSAALLSAVLFQLSLWFLGEPLHDAGRTGAEEALLAFGSAVLLLVGLTRVEPALSAVLREGDQLEAAATSSRQAASRLRSVFELAPDALVVLTLDGRIHDANAAAERLFGTTRDRAIGRRFDRVVTVVGASPLEAIAALTGQLAGSGEEAEVLVRLSDGTERWLEVRSAMLGSDGVPRMLLSARDITERQHARASARELRRGLMLIADQLPAHFWSTDTELRYSWAGGAGLSAIGLTAEDVTGRSVGAFDDGSEGAADSRALHLRALEGETVPYALAYRGQFLEGAIAPARAADGGIVGVVGVALNITAQQRAAEEARANRMVMEQILHGTPAAVEVRDLHGRLQFANRSWETKFGHIGEHAARGFSDRDGVGHESAVSEVIAGGTRTVVEKAMTSQGERSFVSTRFVLRDSSDAPQAVACVLTDMTDEIRMSEELRRRQILLDDAQAMARLAGWETDLRAGRRYWSVPLSNILGPSMKDASHGDESLSSETLFSHVFEEDRARVVEAALAALTRDETYRLRYRVWRADGTMGWVCSAGAVEREADGTPTRFYGFVQDVTEQETASRRIAELNQRLEERVGERNRQLETAVHELRTFSYAVSHDLRQPLRAIAGHMSLLEEEMGRRLGPDAHDFLERVQASARRMDAIIDALLSLSRLTQAPLSRRPLDVSAIARELAVEFTDGEANRRIEWIIADGLRAHADEGLVRVALQNLLANACKFTRERECARIEVGQAEHDGRMAFHVRDNGAGFDPSQATRLFRPFERLHEAAAFEGTGIGLATVARIVRRHGGWIRAEGRIEEGATFHFTLAADPGEPAAA